jgi:membrane protease YdiL (CAAX protease family)
MTAERSRLLTWACVLLAAWSAAWLITLRVLPTTSTEALRFAWWTVMKVVLWLGLAAVLLRGTSAAAWLGAYRGRALAVEGLAVGWVLVDSALVRLGLARAPRLGTGWPLVNVLLVAPLFEEALFRGLLWTRLRESGVAALLTCVLAALAFALLHVPGWVAMGGWHAGLVVQLASTAFIGAWCGLGRWLTGSTWASVLLHFANNAASAGVVALAWQG